MLTSINESALIDEGRKEERNIFLQYHGGMLRNNPDNLLEQLILGGFKRCQKGFYQSSGASLFCLVFC